MTFLLFLDNYICEFKFPDKQHPTILKVLAEELSEPLPMIFSKGEVPDDGEELILFLSTKKAKRRSLGATDQSG